MKKFTFFALAALILPISNATATTWTLQGNDYTVDTLQHVKIGPATTYTSLQLTGTKKLMVFYTTTDLNNQKVDVRTVKANNRYASCTTVSSMANAATTAKGDLYFAGVNADFFGNNAPIGHALVDGEIYRTLGDSYWASFGFTAGRQPVIGANTKITGTLTVNGQATTVSGVNCTRGENNLILYTHLQGTSTGTNEFGTEVLVEPVDGNQAIIGRTSTLRVVSAPVLNTGNMAIPDGGIVISAHGTSQSAISNLKAGDEIELKMWARYEGKDIYDITQMAGGQPVILQNNVVLDTQGVLDHLVANNPRTAVGYNSDNQLVLLVVDGRSAISAGCVSKELAEIMRYTGCTEALNFDGGGSSTMYAGPILGVLNSPSDGRERSVTNGLFLVATGDETDTEVAGIEFKDADENRMVRLPQYGNYTPTFYSFNKDEVLISNDQKGIVLSLEGENANFGEITNNGTTLYVTAPSGTFCLTASYNGITKTIPVTIAEGEVAFAKESILIDNSREYPVEVISSVNGVSMPLDNRALDWMSDSPSVATVEQVTGIVRGVSDGTAIISGTVNGETKKLSVKVEVPTSSAMPAVSGTTAEEWALLQSGGTGLTLTPEGEGFVLSYTGNGSGRGAYIQLTRSTRVWSLPDKIRMRIDANGAPVSKVQMSVTNALGETLSNWALTGEIAESGETTLEGSISEWCDAEDIGVYPITINNIRFTMGASTKGQQFEMRVLGIDGIYDDFDAVSSIEARGGVRVWPNPVAGGETVRVEADGEAVVTVYGMNGSMVSETAIEGVGEVSTAGLAQGVYVVKVATASGIHTAKLIVK